MFKIIWQIVWLMLPAAIANMAPVIFARVPFLFYPVDFGLKIGGKPILGDHKTWRGLFFGILSATLIVYVQKLIMINHANWALFDYNRVNIFVLGLLFGLGALGGDMIKSFFKRRVGVEPGKSWVPFDQIDWVLGTLVALSFYYSLSWKVWFTTLFIFGLLHPVVNLIGFYLRIKKEKF